MLFVYDWIDPMPRPESARILRHANANASSKNNRASLPRQRGELLNW